jgi:hypothetical protein
MRLIIAQFFNSENIFFHKFKNKRTGILFPLILGAPAPALRAGEAPSLFILFREFAILKSYGTAF